MTDTVNPSANTDTSPIITTNDNTPKTSVFDVIDGGLANVPPAPALDLTVEYDKWIASGKKMCHFLVKYPTLSATELAYISSQTGIKAARLGVIGNFTRRFGDYSGKISKLVLIIFKHIGYEQNYSGLVTKDGQYIDENGKVNIMTRLEQVTRTIHIIFKDYGIAGDYFTIKSIVENEIDYVKAKRRREILEAIQYDGNSRDAEWSRYVNHFFDMSHHSEEYVIGVLKKFIHQVKVKSEYKEVNFHLMPIIFGLTGVGKSYFINHYLVNPIKELVNTNTFSRMTDERSAGDWEYLVQVFDECQNASYADVDAIKNRITASHIAYRPMGTNETRSIRNNSTMVGNSNAAALFELIRDPTSNRRFAPLYFVTKMPDPNFDLGFDIVELWKSVDIENDPYYSFSDELTAIQKKQIFHSNVKTWFEIMSDEYDFDGMKFSDAMKIYVQWCRDLNEHSQKTMYFNKDLRNILEENVKYMLVKPKGYETIKLRNSVKGGN